jgi:hypothetical protein
MNRCTHHIAPVAAKARRRFAALLTIGILCFGHTSAQQNPMQNIRPFPPATQRGVMIVTQPPELVLNDKADRLSPGARIRGTDNMLVMSGSLIGRKLLVNFVREPGGMVHEVWVLTEAEAALKLPTQQ